MEHEAAAPPHYLRLLRSDWWFLLLLTLGSGLSAYTFSKLATPSYRVTSELFFASSPINPTDTELDMVRAGLRAAPTYVKILESQSVLSEF